MEQPLWELRYLRYFVALAEELNFRKAAERLHVTTPALSVQIKKLEDLLNVRLCERDTVTVRLTIAGEVLLREGRVLLRHAQDVTDVTREAGLGYRGHLRLGIPGHYSHRIIPNALNLYRERYPKVEVTMVDLSLNINEEQFKALEEGRVHVKFAYYFQPPHKKDTGHLLITELPMRVIMSAQHPLAALEEVALEKLTEYPVLAIQQYSQQTQFLVDLLHKKKIEVKDLRMTDSYNACAALLAAGEGVAMLPEMAIMTKNSSLAIRPIKEVPELTLHVYAIWKKESASPHVLKFVETLREVVGQSE